MFLFSPLQHFMWSFCDLQGMIRSWQEQGRKKAAQQKNKISSKINNFPFSLSIRKAQPEKFLFFSHVLKRQQIINQKITHNTTRSRCDNDGKFLSDFGNLASTRFASNCRKFLFNFSSGHKTSLELSRGTATRRANYAQLWRCPKTNFQVSHAPAIIDLPKCYCDASSTVRP